MTRYEDTENPFAYNIEDGQRREKTFDEHVNPFAFQTEQPSGAASGAGGNGGGAVSSRLMKLHTINTVGRIGAFVFTLLAVLLVLFSKDTGTVKIQADDGAESTAQATAKYQRFSTFEFFLYVHLVVCAYTVLLIIVALVMRRNGTGEAFPSALMWPGFVINSIAITFLLLAFAAAVALEVVNRRGMVLLGDSSYIKWEGMCGNFGRFCGMVETALAASAIGYSCLLASTCIDAYFIHRRNKL